MIYKIKVSLLALILAGSLTSCGTIYGAAAGAGVGAIASGSVGTAALVGGTLGLLIHDIPTRFADVF